MIAVGVGASVQLWGMRGTVSDCESGRVVVHFSVVHTQDMMSRPCCVLRGACGPLELLHMLFRQ